MVESQSVVYIARFDVLDIDILVIDVEDLDVEDEVKDEDRVPLIAKLSL